MVDRDTSGKATSKGASKRIERETRILDAAAELLQKWGYRKTTIDDIAKQAGVAKGSIYLHWKTREELFMALIHREELRLYQGIIQSMAEDPEGMTLYGLVKHSILATLRQPLMKALFLQDTEYLGELVRPEYSSASYQAQLQGYMALTGFLRNHGLIRDDIDLRAQIFILTAISWGFITIDHVMPEEFKFSDLEMVEMMTATLKRILEPDRLPTEEERSAGSAVFKTFMDQSIEALQQLDRAEEP